MSNENVVKMTSTIIIGEYLSNAGLTVNRGDHPLSINLDSKTVDLPLKMEGSAGKIQYKLLDLIAQGMGYSEISRKAILQKGFKESMDFLDFEVALSRVMAKSCFLPAAFEKAISDKNLYMFKGAAIPDALYSILPAKSLPVIGLDDLSESCFTDLRADDDSILEAPMSRFNWLVEEQADVELLQELCCKPENIWTVDRIVRQLILEERDYTLLELAAVLPHSRLEGSKLFVPCTPDLKGVELSYVDDPHLMPNDAPGTKVWMINGKQVVANHYVPTVGAVTPEKAVWVMLNYLMQSTNEADIEGKLAFTSGMFLRGFYVYAHWDDKTKTMAKDAVNIFNVRSNHQDLTPVVYNESGAEAIAGCVNWYLKQGIAAVSDAQVGTAYVKNGAIMRGFDLVWDEDVEKWFVANCNDVSKPGKTTNRGQLSAQQQALVLGKGTNTFYHKDPGGDLNFGDEKQHLLVASGLRMVGTMGKPVESVGLRCRVWLTNWTLSNGSGVVSVPESFRTQLAVRKQETFTVVAVACNGQDPHEFLAEHLKYEDLHKSVWPGDAIAWLDGVPVSKFTNEEPGVHEADGVYGAIVEIGKPKIKNIQTNVHGEVTSFDFTGSISLLMTYNETAAKFRAPGCKWTVMQENFELYNEDMSPVDRNKYPDMLADTENAKQADELITTVKMCADTLPEGWDFNIKNEPNPQSKARFDRFRQENQSLKWIFTETLQDETYDALYREYHDNPDYSFRPDTKQVGQLCTVIEGDLVLSVEVSTVRENVGTQAIIMEQLAALACIHRPLALELYGNNYLGREAIQGMLDMADEEAPDCPAVWELGQPNNPTVLFDGDLMIRKGPKAVFRKLYEQFPDGLTIKAPTRRGETSVNFKFDSVARFSVANDPVGNGTLMLLKHLAIPEQDREDGWDNMVGRYLSIVRGAVKKWALSEGNLQGMCRTERVLHGRKVKPVSRAWVKPGQVGIHPQDTLVKKAKEHQAELDRKLQDLIVAHETNKISDEEYHAKVALVHNEMRNRKGLMAGDHVLISRSPMISVVLLEVVETIKAPIGTYMVSDWDWHRGNEGDGDGDPSAALRVPEDMVKAVRESLQTSVFGPAGYYEAYGTDDMTKLPIMDFYRGADKKRIGYYPDPADPNHRHHREWAGPTRTPENTVASNIAAIGFHYERFVGKAFAMGSALVNKTEFMFSVIDRLGKGYFYDDNEAVSVVQLGYHTACAKMWRRVYEGLALSGISDTAVMFAQHVSRIGRRNRITFFQDLGDTKFDKMREELNWDFQSWPTQDDPEVEMTMFDGKDAVYVAFKLAGIDVTTEEIDALYWAILVTFLYGEIERKSEYMDWNLFVDNLPDHLKDTTLLDDALVFGSLRRLGAGMAKRPGSSTSMVKLAVDLELTQNYMPNWSIMGSFLSEASDVMVVAEEIRSARYNY